MLVLTPEQYGLTVVSGFLVGFSLGLIGGGGSILAIPLLLYFVGLDYDIQYPHNFITHLAIGSTALAVGSNAYINAFIHWRKGNVRLKEGWAFALVGALGAGAGAVVGHNTCGTYLLFLFSILMIIVAIQVWKGGSRSRTGVVAPGQHQGGLAGTAPVRASHTDHRDCVKINWPKLILTSLAVGFASGFFGIGGGFLIVPGLLFSTGICMLKAVGTSLISVGTFGLVTSAVYFMFNGGLVDPVISVLYLLGGIAGGWVGARIASSLPRGTLRKVFAIIIIAVAIYIMYENYYALLHHPTKCSMED